MAHNDSIFVLVDLSYNSPFRNWQNFKDYTRNALTPTGHQPGFTGLGKRTDGSQVGYTVCSTKTDAEYVYNGLIGLSHEGYYPTVHWYDLSYSGHWPYRCNCPADQHRENYHYYKHHVDFIAERSAQATVNYAQPVVYPIAVEPLYSLTSSMQNLAVNPSYYAASSARYAVQAPSSSASYAQSSQHVDAYVTNSQGYPVNAANGLVRAEHNVVVFKNLDSAITDAHLLEAFKSLARPVNLEIRRSVDNKKRAISAVATFKTHKEAKKITEHFRKQEIHIKGRKVRAEIGKDTAPRQPVQAVTVVNGSTAIEGTY